jgi:DNA-directed RNA polymerase
MVHADWGKAQNTRDPLRTPTGRKLADHWSGPLAEYITEQALRAEHHRGQKPRWLSKALRFLDPETIAKITTKSILSALISGKRLKISDSRLLKPLTASRLSTEIGLAVSKSSRLAAFKKANPAYFSAIERGQRKDGSTPAHREAVLGIKMGSAVASEKATEDITEATAKWTTRERHSIGTWLFRAAVKTIGGGLWIEDVRHWKGLKGGKGVTGHYHVKLHPDLYDWLAKDIEQHAARATFDIAMCAPPVPWDHTMRDGGYLLAHITSPHLIRGATPGPIRKKVRRKGGIPQSPILDAVNHLQAVPFEVNDAVFAVASEAVAARLDLAHLPESYRETVPPVPPKEGTPPEEFQEWRRKAAKANRTNERQKARVLWSQAVIREAEELRDGLLWFPMYLDWRGRVYAAGGALNPQGGDLARHLLRFAQGKPIGDGEGPRWLACQVAKAFGHDKITWEERIAWTEAHTDMLKRIAEDPLGNRSEWETEANGGENIWQAYAAAREWTDYLARGRSPEFVSRLPCYVDGTSNGLQHFAALARDSDLGRMVNVVPQSPGSPPADVYQVISDTAHENIRAIASDYQAPDRREALLWLRVLGKRAPRSLTKLIVMVKPYGGSHLNAYDAVREYLDKADPHRLQWGGDVPSDQEENALVGWLASQLHKALGERTLAATNVMRFLRASMKLLCEEDQGDGALPPIDRLDWRTPSGFPWHNLYFARRSRRTSVIFEGEKRETNYAETDTRTILTKRCLTGVAPNYVHSLDAACLMIAVNKMKAEGIDDIITVHDCFAGRAPDMPIIARCVREAFVEVHEADPLGAFREAVLKVLPEDKHELLPELGPLRAGDLDVRQAFDSNYLLA